LADANDTGKDLHQPIDLLEARNAQLSSFEHGKVWEVSFKWESAEKDNCYKLTSKIFCFNTSCALNQNQIYDLLHYEKDY